MMMPLNQMSRCLFPITELESYLTEPLKSGVSVKCGCVNIYVHYVVFTISGKVQLVFIRRMCFKGSWYYAIIDYNTESLLERPSRVGYHE